MDCNEIFLPLNKELPSNSGNVIASVRPESITVSYKENKDWLKVRLKSIQPTGANTILQVQSGTHEITLLQPGFIRMEIDEPLWINFDSDSLNFFDEETGNNLNI
jgi:ABC-type sugar transport system ATPase subunit